MTEAAAFIVLLTSVVSLNYCHDCLAFPTQYQAREGRGRITDDESYVKISEPKYHVDIIFKKDEHKKCIYTIDAYGKGIVDSFTLPCEESRTQKGSSVTSDRYLLYGRPTDPLCLFSDERSTLMVIRDGNCLKVTFATVYTTTYSSENQLSAEDCKELCKKITAVENDPNYYNQVEQDVPLHFEEGKQSNNGRKGSLKRAGLLVLKLASFKPLHT